jgi:hypothetical protein
MDPKAVEELKESYSKDVAAELAAKLNLSPEEAAQAVKIMSFNFDLIITPYL